MSALSSEASCCYPNEILTPFLLVYSVYFSGFRYRRLPKLRVEVFLFMSVLSEGQEKNYDSVRTTSS